jgi:hypothetical protein
MATFISTAVRTSNHKHCRLIFYPEDGGDTFLRNVGSHSDYTAYIPEDGDYHNCRCEELNPTTSFLLSRMEPVYEYASHRETFSEQHS